VNQKATPEEDIKLNENKSITYSHKTACGQLYMTFVYKDDEKLDYVLIEGEGGECGKAFCNSMADMLTFSLKRIRPSYENEISAIIKNFIGHRCNKQFVGVTSCPDAIGQILKKVLNDKTV
jgi:hypothetical protein